MSKNGSVYSEEDLRKIVYFVVECSSRSNLKMLRQDKSEWNHISADMLLKICKAMHHTDQALEEIRMHDDEHISEIKPLSEDAREVLYEALGGSGKVLRRMSDDDLFSSFVEISRNYPLFEDRYYQGLVRNTRRGRPSSPCCWTWIDGGLDIENDFLSGRPESSGPRRPSVSYRSRQ